MAVHLNYRNRGRVPAFPSYFLKPPSSLSWNHAPIERPDGCRLPGVEGEIALVIGTPSRGITPDRAMDHVRWLTAANDVGVYDLRYADRGSNLRSKPAGGFTPTGPALVDPGSVAVGVAVACGGVLVEPGDVIVGDAEGVVVIPPGIAAEVTTEAAEQERQERFIRQQVDKGAGIEGLYPLGPRRRDDYARWVESSRNEPPRPAVPPVKTASGRRTP